MFEENVTGNVGVGRKSMLQIREDSTGPTLFCSQIDGNLNVFGTLAQARVQFTHVSNGINVTGNGVF